MHALLLMGSTCCLSTAQRKGQINFIDRNKLLGGCTLYKGCFLFVPLLHVPGAVQQEPVTEHALCRLFC